MKNRTSKFKKGFLLLSASLITGGGLLPTFVTFAEENSSIYVIEQTNDTNNDKKELQSSLSNLYTAKTPEERSLLPESEQVIINEIERLLNQEVNLSSRTLTEDALNKFVIDLAYGIAFERNNPTFATILEIGERLGALNFSPTDKSNLFQVDSGIALPEKPLSDWFNQLPNTETRTLKVFEKAANKEIYLKAQYIDNDSDKTVILHHGYRSMFEDMLPQAKFFSELGYNILLPDARSHGKSEGEYITFGYYEQDDLNNWINQEVAEKNNQSIYLFGTSMGAATVTMSQKKRHSNVKAVIEDCGFSALEEQFRSVLRLVTDRISFIPIINQFDWYGKETQLLDLLNNRHIIPKLSFDLFNADSPLKSVQQSGVPQLFIHGEADWFIKPNEMNVLYNNAIGYKEKLSVPGADHAVSFHVAPELYKKTVTSFLARVDQMDSLSPIVAEDLNLLKNTEFNSTETGFIDWLTSIDGANFSSDSLNRNKYSEFVIETKGSEDIGTASSAQGNLRLFNRYHGPQLQFGQPVPLIKGETYELSLKASNDSSSTWSYPNVTYGFNTTIKDDALKNKHQEAKKLTYTSPTTDTTLVKLGSRVGYHSWIDHNYTHTIIKDIRLINTDRTPPKEVTIDTITAQENTVTLTGKAETNSKVLIKDSGSTILHETPVGETGTFSISIAKQSSDSLFHVVNMDVKGNTSASKVLYFK